MGSVSSTNPGVANLLQILSNVSSPALSSPAIVSALEQASPTDVVQLSDAAMQLEVVDQMYGISEGSSASSGSNLSTMLANLESSVASIPSAASESPAAASSAAEASSSQAAIQSAEDQALLGSGSTGSLPDSLFSILG